jgi:hypothetical protein
MLERLNAKHGVALMVIITIIIAAFVYSFVQNEAMKQREKEILFDVLDYGVSENDSLYLKMGFINDFKEKEGLLRVELTLLEFENRTIENKIHLYAKSLDIVIEHGESIQEFKDITDVYSVVHSLTIKLIVDGKEMGTKFLVIGEKE